MRIVESVVGEIRQQVFTEVARLAYEGNYSQIDEIPYRIVPGEVAKYRNSIFLERAIVGERLRLAMGLPLRPMSEYAPLSLGVEQSAVGEKYFDPPLVNIIKFACNACPDRFFVTDGCQSCLAHPCVEACPKKCIEMRDRAYIRQEDCIKCGRCKQVCPHQAIIRQERPCVQACGVDAIVSDEQDKATIDQDKCVSCGMCIVNCPFGAISDKGQIFQLVHAMKTGVETVAIVAPSFLGQFGPHITPERLTAALKALGFDHVMEVAVGADLCTIEEAKDFLNFVPREQPFMATSCCPAWSSLAKKEFPDIASNLSMAMTPMVLTGRLAKKTYPGSKVVFIGPCAAKKLEASRKSVRSDVDFVLTYEELMGMFLAKEIALDQVEGNDPLEEPTAAGRGFPVSGGVAKAVVEAAHRIDPDREIPVAAAEGLRECRQLLMKARKGLYDGHLLEGMACPGGCVAGTGTVQNSRKTAKMVELYQTQCQDQNAMDSKYEITLALLVD